LAKAVFRNVVLAIMFAVGANASPAAAQFFSDGYEFLKAVRDRDGDAATEVLESTNDSVINARDAVTGETALHIVTQRRDALWVRFLTHKGANPNVADKNGVTPLQNASSRGYVEGVEVLLKAGANVDGANRIGETALIAAVLRRDVAMVRVLLANGANPDRSDNAGRSARDYASLDASTRVEAEILKSDEERKKNNPGPSYGPSF